MTKSAEKTEKFPSFEVRLQGLVSAEIAYACEAKDAERAGACIEMLMRNAALCIAMACRGDNKGMSDMLEGSTQYLFETTASYKKVGTLIGMGERASEAIKKARLKTMKGKDL